MKVSDFMSKYNPKSNIYTQKFKRENYDTITIYVQKGEREIIKNYAKAVGHSANSLINALIYNELDKKTFMNNNKGSM